MDNGQMDRLKGKREWRWMDGTDNGSIGIGDRAQQSHGLGEVSVRALVEGSQYGRLVGGVCLQRQ